MTTNKKTKMDNFSQSELQEIVAACDSWRALYKALGYKSHGGTVPQVVSRKLSQYNISTAHFSSSHAPTEKKYSSDEEVLRKDTPAATNTVREYYLRGQYSEYKCAICGLLPFWNGQELVLTLDHISGDHTDSRPENLRWVCPNCDRQLPTFGGRNRRKT